MAGYSGTPLPAKLGIRPGHLVALVNAPDGATDLLDPLPEGSPSVPISGAPDP